jgi:hypothetical protein
MSFTQSKVRELVRTTIPPSVRRFLRRKQNPQYPVEDYRRISAIGRESDNIWIKRSSEIGGWLFEGEHEFLWDLAKLSKEGHIVEVGTWMGKSACILAGACLENAPNTKVICVDPFDMSGTDWQVKFHKHLVPHANTTLDIFLANARRFKFIDCVVPIIGYSETVLPIISSNIRMAFLDGAHDYEHLDFEVRELTPKMLAGGVIAIHDTSGDWPEVTRFVRNIVQDSSSLELIGCVGTITAIRVKQADNVQANK